jgi:hypothetical protein
MGISPIGGYRRDALAGTLIRGHNQGRFEIY